MRKLHATPDKEQRAARETRPSPERKEQPVAQKQPKTPVSPEKHPTRETSGKHQWRASLVQREPKSTVQSDETGGQKEKVRLARDQDKSRENGEKSVETHKGPEADEAEPEKDAGAEKLADDSSNKTRGAVGSTERRNTFFIAGTNGVAL